MIDSPPPYFTAHIASYHTYHTIYHHNKLFMLSMHTHTHIHTHTRSNMHECGLAGYAGWLYVLRARARNHDSCLIHSICFISSNMPDVTYRAFTARATLILYTEANGQISREIYCFCLSKLIGMRCL